MLGVYARAPAGLYFIDRASGENLLASLRNRLQPGGFAFERTHRTATGSGRMPAPREVEDRVGDAREGEPLLGDQLGGDPGDGIARTWCHS